MSLASFASFLLEPSEAGAQKKSGRAREGYATVNGAKIFYRVGGRGSAFMSFHGAPGFSDHTHFLPYFDPLEKHFTMIYLDFRGSGRSAQMPPETYTFANFIADADAIREHLGFSKMILLGHSFGGIIALNYALRYQDRLSHLILSGTLPSKSAGPDAVEYALRKVPDLTREELERLIAGKVKDAEEFDRVNRLIAPLYNYKKGFEFVYFGKKPASQFYNTHNAVFSTQFASYDVIDRLHEIKVPTLILCGRHDWITPAKHSQLMAEKIPNSKLVIFEESGHYPYIEENDKYLAAIRDFLSAKRTGA